MSFKSRTEPAELTLLKFLNSRMKLADKDKKRLHNLEKGFEGELMFDAWTEKLQSQSLILNDLLLETNNGKFQLDTVMISQDPLYLFEVKNYEGDYYFEGDRFYALPEKEISNPLLQLHRSESLLRQLLQNLGYRISIEAYVIFIDPQFTCYQAPLNEQIIYPNQLNRFMKKINKRSSNLNGMHKRLAEKLASLHQIQLSYEKLPPYEFGKLKKGFTCIICNSFSMSVQGNKVVCSDCGNEELVALAVIRSVEEVKLLFPERKITSNDIHEWCSVIDCKKRITRILRSNYTSVGVGQWTYYQ